MDDEQGDVERAKGEIAAWDRFLGDMTRPAISMPVVDWVHARRAATQQWLDSRVIHTL